MGRIESQWPLFGLRLRTGDIELSLPDDEGLADLMELTRDPIHDPAVMPFFVPWTDLPEEERILGGLKWHWRCRAEWKPEDWKLELVARRHGTVVGTQGISARDFAAVREVSTGSWVGRRYQGQGVATAMRRAVLHLAFAGLGAVAARSGAFEDNGASLQVSNRLGYHRDGTEAHAPRGERAVTVRLLLPREEWERLSPGWPPVEIEGLEPCLRHMGL
jgi:RimJ/RimL family protein N-acetyltransferase